MLEYLQKFTNYHIKQFWLPFENKTTVCRMYISLEDTDEEKFKICFKCRNWSGLHAEVRAYNKISSELTAELSQHKEYLNSESKLHFAIAMNNSSCKDCRKKITNWIKGLKEKINGTQLQLTLFFSNLYVGEEESVDNVVESFSDWIVDLVTTIGIVVDICPIVINCMLPKQDYGYRLKDLSNILKCDIACLKNFRKLSKQLIKVKNQDESFLVRCTANSDLFNCRKPVKSICMKIFTWENPHYISVSPIDKQSSPASLPDPSTPLPKHIPEPSQLDVDNELEEKPKRTRKYYIRRYIRGKRRLSSTSNHFRHSPLKRK